MSVHDDTLQGLQEALEYAKGDLKLKSTITEIPVKHFLLYGHGGSYNHGAEAIVRTTVKLIREKYNNAYLTLSSHFPEQDREYFHVCDSQLSTNSISCSSNDCINEISPNNDCINEVNSFNDSINKVSLNNDYINEVVSPTLSVWEREKNAVSTGEKEKSARLMYQDALSKITADTILLSVGGDNFCYSNWHRLKVFQDETVRKNARSILWSASIEPSAITSQMVEVLNSYDVITARESKTFNALHEHKIKSKILLIPDVAFNLTPAYVDLPSGFEAKNFIGINISPLVIRRETTLGILQKNILELINFILTKTNLNIALIPHVGMPMDNDYSALSEIYNLTGKNDRIWLVKNDFSAAEYKHIISQCKLLFTSRTHASIAAYSTGVPCAVVGYSIKSTGIANDIELEDYVIPIDKITESDILKNTLIKMSENYDCLLLKMKNKMDEYIPGTNKYNEII